MDIYLINALVGLCCTMACLLGELPWQGGVQGAQPLAVRRNQRSEIRWVQENDHPRVDFRPDFACFQVQESMRAIAGRTIPDSIAPLR